jgi:hypothetical protein
VAKKNANVDDSRPRKRPDGQYEARYWIDTPEGRKRRSVYAATSKEWAQKLADAKKKRPHLASPRCSGGIFVALLSSKLTVFTDINSPSKTYVHGRPSGGDYPTLYMWSLASGCWAFRYLPHRL